MTRFSAITIPVTSLLLPYGERGPASICSCYANSQDSRNSSILSGSVQVGALGSLAAASTSSLILRRYACNRQRTLTFHRSNERTDLSGTCLLTIVKNGSIFILKSSIVIDGEILPHSECKVNAAGNEAAKLKRHSQKRHRQNLNWRRQRARVSAPFSKMAVTVFEGVGVAHAASCPSCFSFASFNPFTQSTL